MSKIFTIYTAGKMGGLIYEEQMKWRLDLQKAIEKYTDKNVMFIHPPKFYQYDENYHKSEREVMDWDINHAVESDIVVVYLPNIEGSIGTHMELGAVYDANRRGNKHIYVIGIGKTECKHPWIDLCLHRQEDNVEDAAEYIVDYLLI